MRTLSVCAALLVPSLAFAQSAPKVGNKPLVQVKPQGCKYVGSVRGAKLWTGDCVESGLPKGSAAETAAPPPAPAPVERQ